MKFSEFVGCGALCLSAALVAGMAGCKSDGVQASAAAGSGSGADLSGPPTFNQQFQTRNPRVCSKVTSPPNESQAAVMAQCNYESASSTGGSSPVFLLVTDVKVQMGAPRAFNPAQDSYWQNIDPSAKVYPLRTQSTSWTCTESNPYNVGKNCSESPASPLGQGRCWKTSFADWQCSMTVGGPTQILQVKGPTTY